MNETPLVPPVGNEQTDEQTHECTGIPNTREVLGEHLYQKVCEFCPRENDSPTLPQKLTGMLLECHTKDIFLMLRDDVLLQNRIAAASSCVATGNDAKLEVGYRLYEKISVMESGLCAQITGMLLELDCDTLEDLLKDDEKLKQAVDKSILTVLKHQQTSKNNEEESSRSTGEAVTMATSAEMGEYLYNLIEPVHPEDAGKITGMLLEMDEVSLQTLLHNEKLLWEKVGVARQALLENCQGKHL